MVQTWIKDAVPSREETYRRLNRFNEHIIKLGVPNPYSWYDLYKADERWKRLHENAVPSVTEFKDRKRYIDECRGVEKIFYVNDTIEDDGDFGF